MGTGAETGAETRVWTGARTRVGAEAAPDPTLEVAESRDPRRGKSPGRDLDLGGPGPGHRGEGRMGVPLITVPGWTVSFGHFLRYIFIISQHFSCTTQPHHLFFIIICVSFDNYFLFY